jgi:glucose-1-phosphate cytidylyltransferase
MTNNQMEVHERHTEPWRVTLVDTGEKTMTGGRLKAIERFIEDDEPFCFTYGDGVSNVDITSQVEFHRQHGLAATVCAVTPPGRFGALEIRDERVSRFQEKPLGEGGMINGGFFVLNPSIFDLIEHDGPWEATPLTELARRQQLAAWKHDGFWQPMDTLRDKMLLEDLWETGQAPWKVW